jgi:hypothetical protein
MRNSARSPGGHNGRTVMLNTDLQVVLMSKMSGATPLVTHVPSWCAQGQLYNLDTTLQSLEFQ